MCSVKSNYHLLLYDLNPLICPQTVALSARREIVMVGGGHSLAACWLLQILSKLRRGSGCSVELQSEQCLGWPISGYINQTFAKYR